MQLDLATVLAQWATGGLLFCWVTTRRREVGIGYGWLLRISFGLMAVLAVIAGAGDAGTGATIRNVFTGVMALAAGIALLQSYARRDVGVRGQREVRAKRAARVASMTGDAVESGPESDDAHEPLPEFDPRLDLVAPVAGVVALFGAASFVGGDYALESRPPAGGRGLPRRGVGRHAARPLVPRAAGTRARARSTSWSRRSRRCGRSR